MGTIKSLQRKEGDPYLALLAYQSTLLAIGYSTAELLMSSRLRSNASMTRQQRKPKIPDSNAVRERDEQLKHNQKKHCDYHHGGREMDRTISTGELVWLPDSKVEAHVGEIAPRSYI